MKINKDRKNNFKCHSLPYDNLIQFYIEDLKEFQNIVKELMFHKIIFVTIKHSIIISQRSLDIFFDLSGRTQI